jgi:hypothetical protein
MAVANDPSTFPLNHNHELPIETHDDFHALEGLPKRVVAGCGGRCLPIDNGVVKNHRLLDEEEGTAIRCRIEAVAQEVRWLLVEILSLDPILLPQRWRGALLPRAREVAAAIMVILLRGCC